MNKKQLITGGVAAIIATSLAVGAFAADNVRQNTNFPTTEAITDADSTAIQSIFHLDFKIFKTENNVVDLQKSFVKEVIRESIINGNTFFTFIKTDDLENLHTGVKIGGRLYDLGKTSMMGRSEDLIQISEAELFGKKFIKVTGIMGTNYAQSSYFSVEKALPSLFLRADGNATEIDIDDDGLNELVSSYGTASCTDIYSLKGGNVTVANVNQVLNAQAVFLSDDKLFEAYFKNKPNQSTFFQFTKEDTLKTVTNPKNIDVNSNNVHLLYDDNITISSVPNIPSVQRQVKEILKDFSFAENYSNLPKPPVGDWRPQTTRIYLTDEEVRRIPEYGIPYGEAADKDENGQIYAIVSNELPKELSEWLYKYNMKIPFVDVPDLKTYEETVLNPIYLNSKWWLDLKGEIEINLRSYEKWFFNGRVPAGKNIVYVESPNNFVYNKPIVKNEPVIETKQLQDPYPVICQDAPNEIVQKAKDFITNKYGVRPEKVHLSDATSYTFQLTNVELWVVRFYSISEIRKEDPITVYINKADNSMTDVVAAGWTPFFNDEQKAEEKMCTKVKKDLYVKKRDMKESETVKIEIVFQQTPYSAETKALFDKIKKRDAEIYNEILKKYPDMKLIEGRPIDNQSGKYFYYFDEEVRDARKELDNDRKILQELQDKDIHEAAQPLLKRLEQLDVKSIKHTEGSCHIEAVVTKEQIEKLEQFEEIASMDVPHYSYDLIE